jgi:hypothetical protein
MHFMQEYIMKQNVKRKWYNKNVLLKKPTCWKAAFICPCPISCSICSCCTWESSMWGAGVMARDRTAVITLFWITSCCPWKPLAICSFTVSQTVLLKLSWMLKQIQIQRTFRLLYPFRVWTHRCTVKNSQHIITHRYANSVHRMNKNYIRVFFTLITCLAEFSEFLVQKFISL